MARTNNDFSTTGSVSYGWYDNAKRGEVRQRVTIASGDKQVLLAVQLPARARNIWADVKNVTAVSVTGSDGTGTADAYALFSLGTSTALATSTASNATASAILTGGTASSVYTSGTGVTTSVATNTSTSPSYLVIAPLSTTGNRISPGTSGTSTYAFNATAQVDVRVCFESYDIPGQ